MTTQTGTELQPTAVTQLRGQMTEQSVKRKADATVGPLLAGTRPLVIDAQTSSGNGTTPQFAGTTDTVGLQANSSFLASSGQVSLTSEQQASSSAETEDIIKVEGDGGDSEVNFVGNVSVQVLSEPLTSDSPDESKNRHFIPELQENAPSEAMVIKVNHKILTLSDASESEEETVDREQVPVLQQKAPIIRQQVPIVGQQEPIIRQQAPTGAQAVPAIGHQVRRLDPSHITKKTMVVQQGRQLELKQSLKSAEVTNVQATPSQVPGGFQVSAGNAATSEGVSGSQSKDVGISRDMLSGAGQVFPGKSVKVISLSEARKLGLVPTSQQGLRLNPGQPKTDILLTATTGVTRQQTMLGGRGDGSTVDTQEAQCGTKSSTSKERHTVQTKKRKSHSKVPDRPKIIKIMPVFLQSQPKSSESQGQVVKTTISQETKQTVTSTLSSGRPEQVQMVTIPQTTGLLSGKQESVVIKRIPGRIHSTSSTSSSEGSESVVMMSPPGRLGPSFQSPQSLSRVMPSTSQNVTKVVRAMSPQSTYIHRRPGKAAAHSAKQSTNIEASQSCNTPADPIQQEASMKKHLEQLKSEVIKERKTGSSRGHKKTENFSQSEENVLKILAAYRVNKEQDPSGTKKTGTSANLPQTDGPPDPKKQKVTKSPTPSPESSATSRSRKDKLSQSDCKTKSSMSVTRSTSKSKGSKHHTEKPDVSEEGDKDEGMHSPGGVGMTTEHAQVVAVTSMETEPSTEHAQVEPVTGTETGPSTMNANPDSKEESERKADNLQNVAESDKPPTVEEKLSEEGSSAAASTSKQEVKSKAYFLSGKQNHRPQRRGKLNMPDIQPTG